MKAVIDRIEDGKTAVIMIEGGGNMYIPAEQFDFEIHEGESLDIFFMPDKCSEDRLKKEIKDLQDELRKRNKEQGK